ncbi:D-3-phosphoglycerate dehydrogenase [Meinhardsimonia xiamenensis]|jgi:D-3-phosphoglycerate dehydrogenase|uniref:D-3-phosphoglycerate dehydrogenase n=1 Tax=Meinhardsimonia xiamenensis TaxID=990712 RepID=A0A1G9CA26_9RHOB|nr:D-2-hydroxyacid dehydrogenase family protein [Meinhardsimonia xiamenensis]PRX38444.1 D-3-phosphoglycerate dehydrogenase [Meinhardsimonia xiamenensis]SDK48274.1 D-3-phosphoglycerate dehydrogenase [Meinhardsimonia xiamenensis]
MKVHILDDWFDTLRHLPSFEKLAGHDVTVWTDHVEDVDKLAERLADAEALVLFRERTPITEELVSRLPKLRLISMRGAYPHVDVEACTRHGIAFASDTSAGRPSVAAAELSFALILAAARGLPEQMASCKAGRWQAGVGQSLEGRTLGIWGFGRLGRRVAQYGRAFDMRVQIWGSEEGRARARSEGFEAAPSREALFETSDFLSLHLRLVPSTRGVVTADDLLRMKPSATLVNTSRAGLVAPGALLAALEAGRPGRIALDVFDVEPLTDPGDPVLSHPRVIATPHIGFVTEDELDRQFSDVYDQINAFAEGRPLNVINPEALRARD